MKFPRIIAWSHIYLQNLLQIIYIYIYSEIPFASATDILTIPFSATVFVDKLSSNFDTWFHCYLEYVHSEGENLHVDIFVE
jgi:hypothetical protein